MATIDAIGLLRALLSHDGCEIDARQFGLHEAIAPFVNGGWLKPAGVPGAVLCQACDEAHWADVFSHDGRLEGLCIRTGETFSIDSTCFYRVDAAAVCRSLAEALGLEGNVRLVLGYATLWTIGTRVLNDTRVTFFFTPSLDRLDVAMTMLEAVTKQARAVRAALIVADDMDFVGLLPQRHAVVALRRIGSFSKEGQITIDEHRLSTEVLLENMKPRRPGRQPEQRDRIMKLLDEKREQGAIIDTSNEFVRRVQEDFSGRFRGKETPARSTVRDAIEAWLNRESR